jgi:uncharacterized protein (TIGR02145 family)
MPKAHLFSYRLPVAETKAVARIEFPTSLNVYFPCQASGVVSTIDTTYGSIELGSVSLASFSSRVAFVDAMVSAINNNIYGYTSVKFIVNPNPIFLDFLSIYIDVTSRPGLGESNNGVQLTSQFSFDGDILNPTQSFSGGISSIVPGCEQIGTMSVSLETTDTIGFSVGNMGPFFYHGPDEDLGYVIAYSSLAGTRTHLRGTALAPNAVGFIRSDGLSYSSFVSLVNDRLGGTYSSNSIGAMVAKYRLNTNGYWTSFPNLWMTRNLDVATYSNGVAIQQATDPFEWESLATTETGAWCYYNFDSANGPIYGKLYNWYAVNDSRGLAPAGYHIPTNAEMTILKNFLNPGAGGHMKESGLVHWSSTSVGADNRSGFTALGSGYFDPTQAYGDYWTGGPNALRESFNCWVSDELDFSSAYYFNIFSGNNNLNILIDSPKNYGYSVRCLKNFT